MKASLIMVGLATAPGRKIDYQWEFQVPAEDFPDFGSNDETPFDAQAPFEHGWSNTTSQNVDAGTYFNRSDNPKAGAYTTDKSKGTLYFMRATEDLPAPVICV
ncbi:uncharacterized protein N7503_009427 [Penicillium pulvis]|uniref:uncharacterized protein n=1 Tax=Penicillium pulvis TaxID=1562058 RepID=UPI002546718B|nr:uncharacterized protein N7503_009427 [Penicillium pulvis]KAJ5784215.1 hypothetical protein N7503_009427 [Penicillium pulvis]